MTKFPVTAAGPGATGPEAWWWWPGLTAPQARPLLFFPPAGADQTIARALAGPLAGQRLGVLRLPGRGPRRSDAPPGHMGQLVGELAASIAALPGPAPVLVGHSFGGLLAYGTAHALQAADRPPARLVVLASVSPAAWTAVLRSHGLDPDDPPEGSAAAAFVRRRVALLLDQGGIPNELGRHQELEAEAESRMITDISLACAPLPREPLVCPITAVTARLDSFVDPAAIASWDGATIAGCTSVTLAGGHFFYRSDPGPLAALLRGELDHLDGAYGGF